MTHETISMIMVASIQIPTICNWIRIYTYTPELTQKLVATTFTHTYVHITHWIYWPVILDIVERANQINVSIWFIGCFLNQFLLNWFGFSKDFQVMDVLCNGQWTPINRPLVQKLQTELFLQWRIDKKKWFFSLFFCYIYTITTISLFKFYLLVSLLVCVFIFSIYT